MSQVLGAEFEKGDVVAITRGENLLFRDEPVRFADEGETFTVLEYRQSESKLFVQSKDEKGNTIALSIKPEAVVLRPAPNGRSCFIQGRRLEGAEIESLTNRIVMIRHSNGATQFPLEVVPRALLRDFEARQRLESGALRNRIRKSRFGMTIWKCMQAIPGLEFKKGSMDGNIYEQQRDDGAELHILTKGGVVSSIQVEWKDEVDRLLLDAVLHIFSEGNSWRTVRPTVGFIRKEWTRSDGGASAQLMDNAMIITPHP